MTTRRQIIRFVPTLPLLTAAGATALLAACGDKKPVEVAAPAPAPAPAPVAAAPAEPVAAAPAAPAPAEAAPPAPSAATTGAMVDEKDATAVALGYVSNASTIDKAKHPTHVAGSACANCALFQGAAGSAQGPCPLFAGKQVSAKGWCTSWNKKAA